MYARRVRRETQAFLYIQPTIQDKEPGLRAINRYVCVDVPMDDTSSVTDIISALIAGCYMKRVYDHGEEESGSLPPHPTVRILFHSAWIGWRRANAHHR